MLSLRSVLYRRSHGKFSPGTLCRASTLLPIILTLTGVRQISLSELYLPGLLRIVLKIQQNLSQTLLPYESRWFDDGNYLPRRTGSVLKQTCQQINKLFPQKNYSPVNDSVSNPDGNARLDTIPEKSPNISSTGISSQTVTCSDTTQQQQ